MTNDPSDFGRMEAHAAAFISAVWDHYRCHRRELPWRRTRDPYEILVSEVMLQQTRVARVLPKYEQFLRRFPDLTSLAAAPVADVLTTWSGLGYNRRALSLCRAASRLVNECSGRIPASVAELGRLPGVGPATAAAVCVFAFDMPCVFIETNIRSAFIHFFFPASASVSDAEILALVDMTMARDDPRDWYYALMDYGVWVKQTYGNPGRRSKHHLVQPPFAGSRRQVRAQVLRILLSIAPAPADAATVAARLPAADRNPEEVASVLNDLVREGFLSTESGTYRVA